MSRFILDTLDLPPSWCVLNARTGLPTKVDRSACLEVTLAEIRQLAGCFSVRRSSGKRNNNAGVFPLPGQRQACNREGRKSTGVFVLNRRMLEWIGSRRATRRLNGDYRGTRSNAMRPIGWQPGDGPLPVPDHIRAIKRRRDGDGHRSRSSFGVRDANGRRTERSIPVEQMPLENILPGNPNRIGPFHPDDRALHALVEGGGGSTARKILGLPDDWTQPIRIEKWQPPSLRWPHFYLVCPRCARMVGEFIEREHRDDLRLPGLSRRPMRRDNAWQSLKDGQCPHRVKMLYLPLCTPAEARDAAFAYTWYRALRPHERMLPDAVQLVERYGPLFPPRALLCRYCLKLHYGCHPDNVRRCIQRRRDRRKADAATAAQKVES